MPKRGRRVLCETRRFRPPSVSMGTARNSKNIFVLLVDEFTSKRVDETSFSCEI